MSPVNSTQAFSNAVQDMKVSWSLLRSNWKAFIATELFSIFAMGIVTLACVLLWMLIKLLFPSLTIPDFFPNKNSSLGWKGRNPLLIPLGIIIFLALLNCQYGLAYDIISSGDMFAEFKSSFTYFKRHWLIYSLLPFLLGWLHSLFEGLETIFLIVFSDISSMRAEISIHEIVGKTIGFFVLFVLVVNILPSITAQGHKRKKASLKQSLSENSQVVKQNPKRLLCSWGLFFIVFNLPLIVLNLIAYIFAELIINTILWFILVFCLVMCFLNGLLIGIPMSTLIATRVYNDTDLEIVNDSKLVNSSENLDTTNKQQLFIDET